MMMIYENIRLALFSLKANKMRALLTMLGIIIGIGSVIAIMTVGDSVTSTVADSMSSLGANNITVTLEERKDDEEASDAMFGMNWGSSQDDNAKQPTQKDYITTDMLRQMKEAFGDSITAYWEAVLSSRMQRVEKPMYPLWEQVLAIFWRMMCSWYRDLILARKSWKMVLW